MKGVSLTFYGGAREVAGSCYLLEIGNRDVALEAGSGSTSSTKILIDCGMFQGCEDCDVRNHAPFPFKASEVDAAIITHAHVDHIGRLPKLFREGFRGPVYSTPPTRDLTEPLLEDALSFFKPGPSELYNASDIRGILGSFKPVNYEEEVAIADDIVFRLLPSGHILGSAFVRLAIQKKIIVFSGDVGNMPSILMPPRVSIPETNILTVESAYGNRLHKHVEDRGLMLERAIEDIAARKGTLMMPVFATERTQEILYEINEMMQSRRVPAIPVFVDSPLAIKITEVFARYTSYYRDEVRDLAKQHPHLFAFKNLKFTPSVEESKAINDVPPPKVILAGSGMSSGGRILHHEKRYLPDPNSILLVTGYQAAGSLGRRILDKKSEVHIHGEPVDVRAEIRIIDGYSAHADEAELLTFVDEMRDNLERVFVVQGEPDAALSFQQTIRDRLGIPAVAPVYGERFEL